VFIIARAHFSLNTDIAAHCRHRTLIADIAAQGRHRISNADIVLAMMVGRWACFQKIGNKPVTLYRATFERALGNRPNLGSGGLPEGVGGLPGGGLPRRP
jgi:hypothetical protein